MELLKECANTNKPIILKRHFGASLRDLFGAAEHILVEGNNKLILCERGISAPHRVLKIEQNHLYLFFH